MIKNETIIVTGENSGYISNTFRRIQMDSYATHDDLIEEFFLSNGIKLESIEFKDGYSMLKAVGMGHLIMENSHNRSVIGIPLKLSSLQKRYLDKIEPFVEENKDVISILNITEKDGVLISNIVDNINLDAYNKIINNKFKKDVNKILTIEKN